MLYVDSVKRTPIIPMLGKGMINNKDGLFNVANKGGKKVGAPGVTNITVGI